MNALCIECETSLSVPADALVGEIVPCPSCGVDLEIAETTPLTLTVAPDIQEDWGE